MNMVKIFNTYIKLKQIVSERATHGNVPYTICDGRIITFILNEKRYFF